MDEALLAAFRSSHFLVCLDICEWADIRIDQALPGSVQTLVGKRDWGFITAWNPQAEKRAQTANLAAQRELHSALRGLPDSLLRPAIGGGDQWHEPSLFVIGADRATLDKLARHHRQLAYVHGTADSPARLCVLN